MRRIVQLAALMMVLASAAVVLGATTIGPASGQPGCRAGADVDNPTVRDRVTVSLRSADADELSRWMVVRPGGSPEEISRGTSNATHVIEPGSSPGEYRFFLFFYEDVPLEPPVIVPDPPIIVPDPPIIVPDPPVIVPLPPLPDPPVIVIDPPVIDPLVPVPDPPVIDPPPDPVPEEEEYYEPRIVESIANIIPVFEFDIFCGSVVIEEVPNPSVAISPRSLTHGETFRISGRNWPPNTRLAAEFSVAGVRSCGVDNRGPIGPFTTDSSGAFSSSYDITSDWTFGNWSVVVCGPEFSTGADFSTVPPPLTVAIRGGPASRAAASTFSAEVNRTAGVSYSWNLFFAGDDIRAAPRGNGSTYTVPALRPGSYVLTVFVDNEEYEEASDRVEIVITNRPPDVAIACPSRPLRNRDLVITTEASDDTGIESYDWILEGPESAKVADGGSSWTVSPSAPGRYVVTVIVEDDDGATERASCEFTIRDNEPPKALLVCTSPILVGGVAQLDGTSSDDPDGEIVAYLWTFDNDTTSQDEPIAVVGSETARTVTATLVVTDNEKAIGRNTCEIQFVERPPAKVIRPELVSGGPYSATVGDTVTLSAAASKPNDGSNFRYTWQVSGNSPQQGETVRVNFDTAGRFPVALTVVYVLNDEEQTELLNTTVIVRAKPDTLSVDPGGPYVAAVGETVSLAAAASAEVSQYRWSIDGEELGTGETIDLSFDQPGEVVVEVAAADTAGRTATAQAIIRVTERECAISTNRVVGFAVDPSKGPAGVTVGATLETDLAPSCVGLILQRTLDGSFFGEPVSVGSDGRLTTSWFIPSNAEAGDHVLGFNRVNSSDVIAENLYVVGDTCDFDRALSNLIALPSSDEAGDDVTVDVTAQLAPECAGISLTFAVAGPGSDLGPGDPQSVGPDGDVSTSLALPPGVEPGSHLVTAHRGTLEDLVLGSTSFELSEPGGGFPLGVAGLLGLPILLGAGGVVVAADRRRKSYGDCVMRSEVVGACDGLREVYENKRTEAEQVEQEAAAANAEAEELERQIRLGPDVTDFDSIDLRDDGLKEQVIDLREHTNPAAPRHGEEQGWFSPGRPEPVKGITVRGFIGQNGPSTPADFIDLASTSPEPLSSHVVASRGGVVRLLPDDYASMPNGQLDNDRLSVAVVAGVIEPKPAIDRAVQWTAQQAAAQKVPIEQIDVTGTFGSLSSTEFLGQVRKALNTGHSFMMTESSNPIDDLRHRAAAAREKATTLEARSPVVQAEIVQAKEDLWECNCKRPPDAPEPADEARTNNSGWYLIRHDNPAGRVAGDGKRGWYRTERRGTIRGIVVHTAEGSSASGVAAYLAGVKRPASAHVVTDPDGPLYLLPDSHEAFHSKHGNRDGLGIEIAYFADRWGTDPELERIHLDVAATWCAQKCLRYGIPPVRLSGDDWRLGEAGFVAHGDLDPSRRRDPGANFDWDGFLRRVRERLGSGSLF